MVTVRLHPRRARRSAVVLIELVVAMGILVAVMIPLAFTFRAEQHYCQAEYYHANAMEVVDGEMEILLAGEWRSLRPGTNHFNPISRSSTNLPPGAFLTVLEGGRLQVRWEPRQRGKARAVAREAMVPTASAGGTP